MTTIDNFTVTSFEFIEVPGVDWSLDNPDVILTLTPLPGYQISAADFSADLPLPQYVASVVFQQSGSNVHCLVTYTNPSIMPSNNVNIGICISGFSTELTYSIDGTVEFNLVNTSIPLSGAQPVSYSASNNYGNTSTVYTQTVVPSAGYYFPQEPELVVSIGDVNNYNITSSSTLDSSSNIVQTFFQVDYTFPAQDVAGDKLTLKATAEELYDPDIEITGYVFPLSSVPAAGQTVCGAIYGIQGAAYDLSVQDTSLQVLATWQGTIDASGYYNFCFPFPAVTANETYTFTLTGDLSPNFNTPNGQPSSWTIQQYVDTTLSFQFTSSNANITVGPADVRTFIPNNNIGQIYQYNVTATSSSALTYTATPGLGDWTFQNGDLPDYVFNVSSQIWDAPDGGTTIEMTMDVTVDQSGTVDTASTLDLDNYIFNPTYTQIVLAYSSISANDVCCVGSPINTYFIPTGDTFATATSIYSDINGTLAADGWYIPVQSP